jgi:hypothetical protein
MDRKKLEEQLELTSAHLAANEALVGRIEGLIAQLESLGEDTSEARQFLHEQRERLRHHEAHWKQLRKQLEAE